MPTTPLSDMIASIRGWINIKNTSRISDAVITSWVRMAEERINNELIVKEMLTIVHIETVQNVFPVPEGYIKAEYARIDGKGPMDYCTNKDYWTRYNEGDNYPSSNPVKSFRTTYLYTEMGGYLYCLPADIFTGQVTVFIGYYKKVPPLTDDVNFGTNWLWDNYPRLYTMATLALSAPWLVEDDRFAAWEGEASRLITMMNDKYERDKRGGANLRPRFKGFG